MSKGSNTQTTNSSGTSSVAPSPQAMAAYTGLLNRAQNVSETPFAPYTGDEVAPMTEAQLLGLNQSQALAAGFAPYAQNAAGYMNAAGEWVTQSDIDRYMDPFTTGVIQATQRDFDVQNARADTIARSQAAAQGALGGNRVGVAQALTREAQERVQDPIIAGLRSAGYQSAVDQANKQKQRELQAGQGLTQAQLAALQQQFGFGTMQQQTNQAEMTQQMQDYYMAQGYPFATAQWLAAITLGAGAQMGSTTTGSQTSTTQGPQPNQFMQAAGLGLSAAAMFSDRRMKENIHEVGELHDGQKIYRFNYKGDPQTQVGLLADEVAEDHPEAVGRVAGFGTVDYDAATRGAVRKGRQHGGLLAAPQSGAGMPAMGATSFSPPSVGAGMPAMASAPSVGSAMSQVSALTQDLPQTSTPSMQPPAGFGMPQTSMPSMPPMQPPAGVGAPTPSIPQFDTPQDAMAWNGDRIDAMRANLPEQWRPGQWQPGQWQERMQERMGMGTHFPGMRASGGRARFAAGGMPGGGMPYGPIGQGWVPTVNLSPQALRPADLNLKGGPSEMLKQPGADMGKMGSQLGQIAKGLYDKDWTDYSYAPSYGGDLQLDNASFWGGGMEGVTGGYDRGGGVGRRRGYANGAGVVSSGWASGLVGDLPEDDLSELPPINVGGTYDPEAEDTALRMNDIEPPTGLGPTPVRTISYKRPGAMSLTAERPSVDPDALPPQLRNRPGIPPGSPSMPATALTNEDIVDDGDLNLSAASKKVRPGVGAAPRYTMGGFNPLNMSDEARRGLVDFGVGMASFPVGGKGHILSGVAAGARRGLESYDIARERNAAEELQARREQALTRKEEFEREKFEAPYSRMTMHEQRMVAQHAADLKERQLARAIQLRQPVEVGSYRDEETGMEIKVKAIPRLDPKSGEVEYYVIDPKTQTVSTSPLGKSLREPQAAAAPPGTPPGTPASPQQPRVQTASFNPDDLSQGVVRINDEQTKEGAPLYDYSGKVPLIEKGFKLPRPKPVAGHSTQSIEQDAERYMETGDLPKQALGQGATAIMQNKYRNAVQNYAIAKARSLGVDEKEMLEMQRSSKETFRWMRSQQGTSTVSLGTAMNHMETLRQIADEWKAGNVQLSNRLRVFLARQFGDEKLTSLEAAAQIVGAEVVKGVVGSQNTGGEREEAGRLFGPLLAGKQIFGNIKTVEKLLAGQLTQKEQLAREMGVNKDRFKRLVGEDNYKILERVAEEEKKNKTERANTTQSTTKTAAPKKQVIQRGWVYEEQEDGSYKPLRKAP